MSDSKEKGIGLRSLVTVCVLVAIHVLLVFTARSIPAHRLLFLFFFFSLVVLPGYLAASILFPRARIYYTLLFSLVLGTAQIFILLMIFSVFSLDIFYISMLVPILTLALVFYRFRGTFNGFDLPNNSPLSTTVIIIMFLVVILVSILTLGIGDAIFYTGDAQDHMAYIRAIERSHRAFPDQFIYRDGGLLTRDIRRGLLHSVWGTASLLTARSDVQTIWPIISWTGSLFLLLAIFCLGMQFFDDQRIAILGVIFYIFFFQRGLAGHHMITAAYGFHLGKIYLYAFMIFALQYVRTNRGEFLLMAAAASFGAIGTHVSYVMIIPFFVFFLIIVELLRTNGEDRTRLITRTVPLLVAAVSLINLPYLLIRYFRDFHPANEIHTHVHGMLFFTDDLAVLNPFLLSQADGVLMTVSFVAIFLLWKKSRSDGDLRLLLVLTAGFLVLIFNPLWVPFLMDKITYLIVRFSASVPTMLLSAYLVHTLWQRIRGRSDYPSKGTAIIGSLIVVAILLPALARNITDFQYGGAHRRMRDKASAKNLADLYDVLNEKIPAGSIIASDPLTSYCLLAFTDQYVVCTYDQHSTPNDSTALDRIKAVRDIYLPFSSCADITGTLDEYNAEYVVINGRIPPRVRSEFWKPDRENAAAAASKLIFCKENFELVYSYDSVLLFRYLGGEKESSGSFFDEATGLPVTVREDFTGEYDDLTQSGVEGLYLREWGKDRDSVKRGETIRLYVDWVAKTEKEFGSYLMYVRFDTDFEKGPLYNPRCGKIYRKIVEKARGERYRFRIDKLPFEGIYPPDKWMPGKVMREYFDVPVPKDIAPGTYTISIRLDMPPHVSNLRLKDLFSDDDFYDGPDLMQVIIE
jgi:hypothetical protein